MPQNTAQQPLWPTEIRLGKDRRALTVSFDNGERFELPAEYLRVESPSAVSHGVSRVYRDRKAVHTSDAQIALSDDGRTTEFRSSA